MALTKDKKQQVMKNFGINAEDTGSEQVQVALLTERIANVTEHLKKNAHDFSSKRGLLKMVARRRKILQYLESTNQAVYNSIIQRLELKKIN
ncbi:MAG: 30S ribosomal protein S15 [Candidatus Dependentiae bacterium]|nr:30S ribosomal protein S15 [Candidatus Dependentiae bacterium]